MIKTLTIFGTRPEAIKLAPVIEALSSRPSFKSVVCSTGQHLEMLQGVLEALDIPVDYDLGVMKESQTLSGLTSRLLTPLDSVIQQESPDIVLVQGDTTTAFAGALVGFYHKIPVGHVEAGLRSGDKKNPFPEELNRRLADTLSDLYFAPTEASKINLLNEGFSGESIKVTGNTVIDSLMNTAKSIERGDFALDLSNEILAPSNPSNKLLLVTLHRRESFDAGIANICNALRTLIKMHKNLRIVFPVHLNPKVRETVYDILQGLEQVRLLDPLNYVNFVGLMMKADLIITDSGGIQEEAPSLGIPVLVARDKTERPEAIESGTAKLVGTGTNTIVKETTRLLEDKSEYRKMATKVNPFGSGNAGELIVDEIEMWFLQR